MKNKIIVSGLAILLGLVGVVSATQVSAAILGTGEPSSPTISIGEGSDYQVVSGVTTLNFTGTVEQLNDILFAYKNNAWYLSKAGDNLTLNATITNPTGVSIGNLNSISGNRPVKITSVVITATDLIFDDVSGKLPNSFSFNYQNAIIHLAAGATLQNGVDAYKNANDTSVTVAFNEAQNVGAYNITTDGNMMMVHLLDGTSEDAATNIKDSIIYDGDFAVAVGLSFWITKDGVVHYNTSKNDDGTYTISTEMVVGSVESSSQLQASEPDSENSFGVQVTIPANTIASGADHINAPIIVTGYTANNLKFGDQVIRVGGDSKITLSQAVKITFAQAAGKRVGFGRNSTIVEISTLCDDNTNPTNLGDEGDCKIDVGSDLVVFTKHLTDFGLITNVTATTGEPHRDVWTTPSTPGCSDNSPNGVADLFQIDRKGSSATLYFTPVSDNTNYYHVVFGNEEGEEMYGQLSAEVTHESNNGVQSVTINDLDPKAKYAFQVMAVNGCAVGERSNWLTSHKTGTSFRYNGTNN